METDKFLEEMLKEVTSLKDLAKQELPLVAKEYILAQKVMAYLGLALGGTFLLTAIGMLVFKYAYEPTNSRDDLGNVMAIISMIPGTLGVIITSTNLCSLINLYLQPRRMAIKAITSLKGN